MIETHLGARREPSADEIDLVERRDPRQCAMPDNFGFPDRRRRSTPIDINSIRERDL